ncbi:MAG TPA: alpha/beta fold hydrolase, partial [Pirellulaceae bacterium]
MCHRPRGILWLPLVALLLGGCRSSWHEPRPLTGIELYAPALLDPFDPDWKANDDLRSPCSASAAEPSQALPYVRSLAWDATLAERSGSPEALDSHYLAALHAWSILVDPNASSWQRAAADEIYHTSLARFLATASTSGRLLPGQGIVVHVAGRPVCVPFQLHGFVWRSHDVQALYPVCDYDTKSLSSHYQCEGIGVPVVVERQQPRVAYPEESFLPTGAMFAATVLLRPSATGGQSVIEFFDPLRPVDDPNLPDSTTLAADISAPFALRAVQEPQLASGWIPFITSESPAQEGLFFIEPYQRGKIPIVFVHGLLSSPTSWVDMANDLRAVPGLTDHFQFWSFRYSTNNPFLRAAARLRQDLYRAVATVDPTGQDAALNEMVLVGHSMGGLVCKLQASATEDRLWRAIANRPLEAIVTDEQTRSELREQFFFQPQPNVRRVIMLATPHLGSSWAQRPLGRLGASLAGTDEERIARHDQLMTQNPGVFSPEVTARIPTSIDML